LTRAELELFFLYQRTSTEPCGGLKTFHYTAKKPYQQDLLTGLLKSSDQNISRTFSRRLQGLEPSRTQPCFGRVKSSFPAGALRQPESSHVPQVSYLVHVT
jgi:hypothetical protein